MSEKIKNMHANFLMRKRLKNHSRPVSNSDHFRRGSPSSNKNRPHPSYSPSTPSNHQQSHTAYSTVTATDKFLSLRNTLLQTEDDASSFAAAYQVTELLYSCESPEALNDRVFTWYTTAMLARLHGLILSGDPLNYVALRLCSFLSHHVDFITDAQRLELIYPVLGLVRQAGRQAQVSASHFHAISLLDHMADHPALLAEMANDRGILRGFFQAGLTGKLHLNSRLCHIWLSLLYKLSFHSKAQKHMILKGHNFPHLIHGVSFNDIEKDSDPNDYKKASIALYIPHIAGSTRYRKNEPVKEGGVLIPLTGKNELKFCKWIQINLGTAQVPSKGKILLYSLNLNNPNTIIILIALVIVK